MLIMATLIGCNPNSCEEVSCSTTVTTTFKKGKCHCRVSVIEKVPNKNMCASARLAGSDGTDVHTFVRLLSLKPFPLSVATLPAHSFDERYLYQNKVKASSMQNR